MSAGFATYLGPYQYNFRRLMLTIHWPNCLRERGIPLAIDSIDEVKGIYVYIFLYGSYLFKFLSLQFLLS